MVDADHGLVTRPGHQVGELLRLLAAADARPGSLALAETAFRHHVATHADDPNLTGASVALALGWSLRQIQLALQQAGTTPREVIRDARLRRAHRRLLDPALRHLGTDEIAFASGFSSASTFREAFRRRYGVAPRELRRMIGRAGWHR